MPEMVDTAQNIKQCLCYQGHVVETHTSSDADFNRHETATTQQPQRALYLNNTGVTREHSATFPKAHL
jgi:hypothetical protein